MRARLPRWGGRAFWFAMALAHMPGLVTCWRGVFAGESAGALEGAILLTVSMTFFALKVADVSWLRFRVSRRSAIAFCVIVAFLHVDVVRRGDQVSAIPEYTSIVATTMVAGRALQVRRDLAAPSAREQARITLASVEVHGADTVWTDTAHPHCWSRICYGLTLRAPPA